jgi:lipid-A-disaccharide synthase
MGTEAEVLATYPEVDRIQAPQHFWDFFLWGKTAQNWDWHPQGVVLFLGGDQFFVLAIAKRLGYKSLVYAEWEARWYRWLDGFAAINERVKEKVSRRYQEKVTIVGDLMVDVTAAVTPLPLNVSTDRATVALMMGSKPSKLSQGVPLTLAIAEYIYNQRPHTDFIAPVAPTVELESLAKFAQSPTNPIIAQTGWSEAQLIIPRGEKPYLETSKGLRVTLLKAAQARENLACCHLALTTVGANTAELAALKVPMLVLLPTQELDAMKSWDGLPGLLANLPGVGSAFAKGINWAILQQKNRLFAWPNIWAQSEIVPELVGRLEPEQVGKLALDWLNHPEKLGLVRDRLEAVCGSPGAALKIAELVAGQLDL